MFVTLTLTTSAAAAADAGHSQFAARRQPFKELLFAQRTLFSRLPNHGTIHTHSGTCAINSVGDAAL